MHRANLLEAIRSAKRNALAAEAALKQRVRVAEELNVDGIEAEAMLARWRQVKALRTSELDRLQSEFYDAYIPENISLSRG